MTEQSHDAARLLRSRLRWLSCTPLHPQWLMPDRKVSNALRDCRGVVLDIGAADRWLRAALHPDACYVALDYPATAVGLYGLRPDVFADAQQLPFADGSIDAIACFEVLEHVPDPNAVVQEIKRVLAPGGVADMSMPFLYPVHDAPFDFQRWTSHGWQKALAAAGLEVVRIEAANHPLHAAAVLLSLSLAGPLQALRGWRRTWRLPIVALCVTSINLVAWVLARAWPPWGAFTTTHHVVARKPA